MDRRQSFVGVFLICTDWHFWVSNLFSSNSGIYEAERKPREISITSFLGAQALSLSSLRLCKSSHVRFLYNVRVLVMLIGRNRAKFIRSISLEEDILRSSFMLVYNEYSTLSENINVQKYPKNQIFSLNQTRFSSLFV